MTDPSRARLAGALAAVLATCAAAVAGTADIRPPAIRFTTDDAFEAEKVPAYSGRHEAVYAYIDAHLADHLDNLRRWVRQPSVSAQVRQLSGYVPAQTSVEAPLVQAVIGVFNKHGVTPSVPPRLAGSAPYFEFTDRLKLPLVPAGLGHGSGAHAPDEYMVIEPKAGSKIAGLAAVEKFYVDALYALAAAH